MTVSVSLDDAAYVDAAHPVTLDAERPSPYQESVLTPLILLIAAPPTTPAPAPANMAPCERWSLAAAPSAAETRACVPWVLTMAYGGAFDAQELDLDPSKGTAAALQFAAFRLRDMAKQVGALCPDGCLDVSTHPREARAREWLEAEADARFTLFDAVAMESIEAPLAHVLAGKPLTVRPEWSALTLWKLRNAVFARHGRPFDNPDLRRFFYGPDGPRGAGLPLQPSKVPWSDARLSAQDTKTVAALVAAAKKVGR